MLILWALVWGASWAQAQGNECRLPWGGSIEDGRYVVAWENPRVTYPGICRSEYRYCQDGRLSGFYYYPSCRVVQPHMGLSK